jgi:ABC-type multidrug transport system fused ATPase/permease subunit
MNKVLKKTLKRKETFSQFMSELKGIYRPHLKVIALIVFIIFLEEALSLIGPFIYGKIIDGLVQGKEMLYLIKLSLLSLSVLLLNDTLLRNWVDRIEIKKFDFDVRRTVAVRTLDKLMDFSIGQHENQNSGLKKSIIDKGQTALTELAFDLIYHIFPAVLQVFVIIVALFIVAPILGLIILIGVSLFFLIIMYTNKTLGDDLRKIQEMYVDSDKRQSEYLRSVSLIKANAKEKQIIKEYDNNLLGINDFAKKIWLRFNVFLQGRSLVPSVTRITVLITGIYLVYRGFYTPGFLVIFLSWSTSAFDRIAILSQMHRRLIELYSQIKNYFTLMNVEPEIKEIENPIVIKDGKGRIEYKKVDFVYPAREEIIEEGRRIKIIKNKKSNKDHGGLKSISTIIDSGQRVAIVGHSGAGKSTMIQLLIRAYDPEGGSILIDGHDLKDLSLNEYRQSLGIVPQDVVLFDDTLRYNILFGTNKNVSEEELDKAVRMARVDEFLGGMENGLDTVIGERGVKLSGGERQRVGIARALAKDPLILIFDEATSSLDVENEAIIRESIEKASKGRTTMIIAHRLSTIKDADKIIVMEKGKIVGEGKHEDLLKNNDIYKKMINIQTVIVGGN